MTARLTLGLTLTLLIGCHGESAHIKSAREHAKNQEWKAVGNEIAEELKERPSDDVARGIALYAQSHSGDDKADAAGLLAIYSFALEASNQAAAASPEAHRERTAKKLAEVRKMLFDSGIDSKDAVDLVRLGRSAARFGFDYDNEPRHKAACATILAGTGDADALEYLIQRLKGNDTTEVVSELVSLGGMVLPRLRKLLADEPEFLGRDPLLEATREIERDDTAGRLAEQYPGLVDPSRAGSASSAYKLPPNEVSSWLVQSSDVHASFAAGENGRGVYLFQGWSARAGAITARLYQAHDGQLTPLRTDDTKSPGFSLDGPSALYDLKLSGDVLAMTRTVSRSQAVEVETGAVASPAVGMKVHLEGYRQSGKIIRRDEGGLWVVHVDAPIEGMSDLPVAATSLIGLRDEIHTRTEEEQITGTLHGDTLEVSSAVASDKCADAAAALIASGMSKVPSSEVAAAKRFEDLIASRCREDAWPPDVIEEMHESHNPGDWTRWESKLSAVQAQALSQAIAAAQPP